MDYLKWKRELKDYNWISNSTPYAPYDFVIIDKNGERILIDVKSTDGEFGQRFFISYNELKQMAQSEERYDLYRVYKIKKSSAMLRICKDTKAFSRNILGILERLPNGVIADSVAVSPSSLKFNIEITLHGEHSGNQ